MGIRLPILARGKDNMVIMSSDIVVQLDQNKALVVRKRDDAPGIVVYNIMLPNNTMKGMSYYTPEQADRLMKAIGQALYQENE